MTIVSSLLASLILLLSACTTPRTSCDAGEDIELAIGRVCGDSLECQVLADTKDSIVFIDILHNIKGGKLTVSKDIRSNLKPYESIDSYQLFAKGGSREMPAFVLKRVLFPDSTSAQEWVELLYSSTLDQACGFGSGMRCYVDLFSRFKVESVRVGRCLYMLYTTNPYSRAPLIEDFIIGSDGVIHSYYLQARRHVGE